MIVFKPFVYEKHIPASTNSTITYGGKSQPLGAMVISQTGREFTFICDESNCDREIWSYSVSEKKAQEFERDLLAQREFCQQQDIHNLILDVGQFPRVGRLFTFCTYNCMQKFKQERGVD